MTNPSSSAAGKSATIVPISRLLLGFVIVATIFVSLWLAGVFRNDPYVEATLELEGSINNGENLFRVNCVGCHGISAQGLLGPDLHSVTDRLNDKTIINQVIKGRTPPMPSFEMDPQAMADMLTYLNSLK